MASACPDRAIGTLRVDALIDGVPLPIGVVTGLLTGDEWQPSPTFLALANLVPDTQVAFRFTAGGLGSAFAIGDVYVDPYGKG